MHDKQTATGAGAAAAADAGAARGDVNDLERVKRPRRLGDGISWNQFLSTDATFDSTVSVAKSVLGAVEVHDLGNRLYYRVGLQGSGFDPIRWGPLYPYDTGVQPSVGLDDAGGVVEVHKSEHAKTFWCRVGKVDWGAHQIQWGDPAVHYDNGEEFPRVALFNGYAVEVHRSDNVSPSKMNELLYNIGKVDFAAKTIIWCGAKAYDKGIEPSVALGWNGAVVEVHRTNNLFTNTLYYRVGQLVSPDRIEWGPSTSYDSGREPHVAVNADGQLVEIHKSQSHETIWVRSGRLNVTQRSIAWSGDAGHVRDGRHPSIAIDKNSLIAVTHADKHYTNVYTIDCGTGWFVARAR